MKGRRNSGQKRARVHRGSGRSPRRGTSGPAAFQGSLAEEELAAIMDAQFPSPPRRRRKAGRKKRKKKAGSKRTGTRKGSTEKKGTEKVGTPEESPKRDTAKDEPVHSPDEPFGALRTLAEASDVPQQAEALWTEELLDLVGRAAAELDAEVEKATAAHAEALAAQAKCESSDAESWEAGEREPAFLQLLPDDYEDDDDAPLEVFDADALGAEIGDWDTPQGQDASPTGPVEIPRGDSQHPAEKVFAGSPATAPAAPDPEEWNAMVSYLATRREAASTIRAASSLQRRAAAAVAELTPRREAAYEVPAGPLLAVGILLVGWAATYYVRTGDLRIALGMLAWASCAGCALAMFQQRPARGAP